MPPLMSFVGGLLIGVVAGVVICAVLLAMFGGFCHAMGAHSRMHIQSSYPVAIRFIKANMDLASTNDQHHLSRAVGIMKSTLEQSQNG